MYFSCVVFDGPFNRSYLERFIWKPIVSFDFRHGVLWCVNEVFDVICDGPAATIVYQYGKWVCVKEKSSCLSLCGSLDLLLNIRQGRKFLKSKCNGSS